MTSIQRTIWAVTADEVDELEACDSDIVDGSESIDIGPFGTAGYVRLSSPDLVLVADALRRLADKIIDGTVDVREQQAQSECPWCPTVIEEGDEHCGATECAFQAELEDRYQRGLVP